MFTQLKPLFRKGGTDTILITMSLADDGRFVVAVNPRLDTEHAEAAKIINRPIHITATAEELDAEFHANLGEHAVKLAGARTTFAALTQDLAAAEADLRKRTDETKKKKADVTPPAAPQPAEPAMLL